VPTRRHFVLASACAIASALRPRDAWARAPRLSLLHVPLRFAAGESVGVGLELPGGEGWDTANVGRAIVRSGGQQVSLALRTDADGRVRFAVRDPGAALLVVSAGPSSESNRPDAWQHATFTAKAFLRVTDPRGSVPLRADPGTTAKVGLPTELLPLVSPLLLRVGDVLPVRAYVRNASRAGAVLHATRPGGEISTAATDDVGTTELAIDRAGTWLVEFAARHEGRQHLAQLMFEVPEHAP
jgi:hypothetical protein